MPAEDGHELQGLHFRPGLEAFVEPGEGLFLLSERGFRWYGDPLVAAVASLLDGKHDLQTIFRLAGRDVPMGEAFRVLDHFRAAGYLVEAEPEAPRHTVAFWENAGVAHAAAIARLGCRTVAIRAFGAAEAGPLPDLLHQSGIRIAAEGDVTLVLTDDYLRPELRAWNAAALQHRQPWLLAKPVGLESWLGPFFVPGETACWACLAQRLRGHRKLEGHIADRHGRPAPLAASPSWIPSMPHAALAEAATEIARWIGADGQTALRDRVVATDALTLARTHHLLTRRPQCEACGDPAPPREAPSLRLQPRPKRATADGGHRAEDGLAVLARLERHLSPITGIVSTLVPGERTALCESGATAPIATLEADHNFSDMADARFFLREGLRRRSGGKGKSLEQVRLSALAESIERYSGVFDGTEPRIRATFRALGEAAIHPNACLRFSERQYAQADAALEITDRTRRVPPPFREDAEIEWTPLRSLADGGMRYLPTSLCYFGYRSPDPIFGRGDSNGCAAGAVPEEAILQGFLELVERDAVALWWYNRVPRPGIDLDSIDDPYVAAFRRHYAWLRREVWALDLTSDLGIPAVAALSRRVDKAEEDIIYGFGAHLDPAMALLRALTELNQSLEAVPSAAGDESMRSYRGSAEAEHWWRSVRAADTAYLLPDPTAPQRNLRAIAILAARDLLDDIALCRARAAAAGLEVYVLDQTRPDIGFPTVRVVVPGLRHFWARFGPGRLYDVPVRLGWLDHPRPEEELNPFVVQF